MSRFAVSLIVASLLVLVGVWPAVSSAAPPANDNFAAAKALQGIGGSMAVTNVEATKEPGEPSHGGNPGGASIWFRWIAPVTGHLSIFFQDEGSEPSLLAAYTGSSVDALTEIPDPYPYGWGTSFAVVKGTRYFIAVDGQDGQTGSNRLGWSYSNDNFVEAWPIARGRGRLEGDNYWATEETGEPQHGFKTVWFSWIAPKTAWFRFHADPAEPYSSMDSVLSVYRGSELAALDRVALNRGFFNEWWSYDWYGWSASAVSFRAVKGATYRIAIGAQFDDPDYYEWPFVLRWFPGRIIKGRSVLVGTPGDDYLDGRAGDDVILGMGGADTLIGRLGADVMHGGPGNDRLIGRLDDHVGDRIFGDRGWDRVRAGRNDMVFSSERIER